MGLDKIKKEYSIKPFVKWVGGKTRLLPKIKRLLPNQINVFYEPFVGGGSVFLNLLQRMENGTLHINAFRVSDANEILINAYQCVKHDVSKVLQHLKRLKKEYQSADMKSLDKNHSHSMKDDWTMKDVIFHGKSYVFYYYRAKYNVLIKKRRKGKKKRRDPFLAALFIFLNKTCFRGLYTENRLGQFNVSFGHYMNPSIFTVENLIGISGLLRKYKVLFKAKQFSVRLYHSWTLQRTDFVFLDPPYVPLQHTTILKYTKDTPKFQHEHVVQVCKKLTDQKVPFICCNSLTPFTISNFVKNTMFSTEVHSISHLVDSKSPSKKKHEILVHLKV